MMLTFADNLKRCSLAAVAGLALIPAATHAAPMTYAFSGVVDGTFGTDVPQGTPFSGTLSYNPDLPRVATSADESKQGTFGFSEETALGTEAGIDASVDFGDILSFVGEDPSSRTVTIQNGEGMADQPFDGSILDSSNPNLDPTRLTNDAFQVNVKESSGALFQFNLTDPEGEAFGSAGLPTTLDLDDFQVAYVLYVSPDFSGSVHGRITDLTLIPTSTPGPNPSPQPVPEPATLTVLGLGVVGLFLARRRVVAAGR